MIYLVILRGAYFLLHYVFRRQVHPTWWHASAKALGVEENPLGEGFGVTPAVLSTIGSMLTLQRLREVHGRDDFLDRMFNGFAQTPDKW